jgi:hypothetical protein
VIAESASWDNTVLSLVGIGPDVSLSMCTCKHFACVLNPEAIGEVMDNWMQTMQAIYAQNLLLQVQTSPGSKVVFAENAEGTIVPPDGVLTVPIANLYSETPFRIGVIGNAKEVSARFLSNEDRVFSLSDADHTAEFTRLQIELATLTAIQEALKLASLHNFDQVRTTIDAAKATITAMHATEAQPHIASLDQIMESMSDHDSYRSAGSGLVVCTALLLSVCVPF